MAIVLNDPEDVVATIHHDSELVLCNGCSKDWYEKHGHFVLYMSFTRILAKNCGIHEKCDGCHANFLDTEF